MALYERLRPMMRGWYAMTLMGGAEVPKPRDDMFVRTNDPAADRVLLLGNGPCHGWGVVTYQLALPGKLSRALKRHTGRSSDVDYIGSELMNMESAIPWLGNRKLDGYDAAAVVIGINDAVRLIRISTWEKNLRALLEKLTSDLKPTARILLAGIQSVRSVSVFGGRLGAVADLHRRRMNRSSAKVAAEFGRVTFFAIESPPADPDRPMGSPDYYAGWAELIAHEVAPALDAVRGDALSREPMEAEVAAWDWEGAARVVELAASGGSPELQRLATEAQQEFGVELAVVTLFNGDRIWYAMNTEALPASAPLELTYCKHTAELGAALIVPDARLDPRFSQNPLIDLTAMPFYAGYPLQSSAGETIGTFCLHGSQPRDAASVPLDTLREMAMRAQAELQSYEHLPAPVTRPDTRLVEPV